MGADNEYLPNRQQVNLATPSERTIHCVLSVRGLVVKCGNLEPLIAQKRACSCR